MQLEGDMKVLGDRIIAAKADQVKAAMRLSVAEERVRREGPLGLLSWDAGPGADELLAQARAIADMRREAAKMSATVGAFNPNVARLEAEAKALEAKTNSVAQVKLANLRISSDAAAKEAASLEKGLQGMRADYDRLEAASVQLTALQQAAAAARTVYQNFEARWKTTEQTGFNEATGWHLSPASAPVRPSSPSIPLVLIASAIAGLGLGLSSALWKEYRYGQTFRSSEDVERLIPGMRSLGLLPELSTRCRSARDVVDATGTSSDPEFEEAVGTVWTAITRAVSRIINLRVVRSCWCLRHCRGRGSPRQWGSSHARRQRPDSAWLSSTVTSGCRRWGMHSALRGTLDWRTASKGLRNTPASWHSIGLSGYLCCRPGRPAGAAAIAAITAVRGTVVQSAQRVDWIVIDSPPVLGLSDARLLAKMADHTVSSPRGPRQGGRWWRWRCKYWHATVAISPVLS